MESKDMMSDVLESVKNMVVNYSIALNEASSKFIYNEYLEQFENLSILAKELYNFSYNVGFVSLTKASSKDIKKEIEKQSCC